LVKIIESSTSQTFSSKNTGLQKFASDKKRFIRL
jgi:hypothetical protein